MYRLTTSNLSRCHGKQSPAKDPAHPAERRHSKEQMRWNRIRRMTGRGLDDRYCAVTQRDTLILECRAPITSRTTITLAKTLPRRVVTAYAGTQSTDYGRGALAPCTAPADNTTVAAPCDPSQQQPPTVVVQDIDLVGCSPDDLGTGPVCDSATRARRDKWGSARAGRSGFVTTRNERSRAPNRPTVRETTSRETGTGVRAAMAAGFTITKFHPFQEAGRNSHDG
jgi:hypothetical protein